MANATGTRLLGRSEEVRTAYLYLLPALLFMAALVGYPLLRALSLSFFHDKGFGNVHEWVGLQNYIAHLSDPFFWATLFRTLVWTVSSVVLKTVLGLVGAELLHRSFAGRGVTRSLVLPPWIVPLPIGAYVWSWMFNGQHGILNGILLHLQILDKPFEMLAYPTTAFLACLINDVWVGVPFMTLVTLAGLQAIPNELYEAAVVDGSKGWQNFWHITLPQLKDVLLIGTLLSSVWTFNSFDIIWVQTGGGPLNATTTLVIQTYKAAFKQWTFGMSATLAVITFVILAGVSVFYSRFILKGER
jgi:multiple sugar transport system permease protein